LRLIKLTQRVVQILRSKEVLAAFTAGLLLITISELGDKTFFIAMILAMRYSRRCVLAGVIAALATMTVLSVLMGQAVSLLPQRLIDFAKIALFLGFGFKLLYDASKMPARSDCTEILAAKDAVEQAGAEIASNKHLHRVLLQSFTLTFLAEWGDRTQITTTALAASNNPIGVTLGAITGHAICAVIAVLGGCLVAGKISERTITAIGGGLFRIFGIVAAAGAG
jgi:putative Ca2+/H+ antiporter (TMEM165/GDT1 family)